MEIVIQNDPFQGDSSLFLHHKTCYYHFKLFSECYGQFKSGTGRSTVYIFYLIIPY